MNVLVVGAGAIGALYGAMLQKVGARISILCRSGCRQVRENGIFVKSIWGDMKLVPRQVYFSSSELPPVRDEHSEFDLILVATKSFPGDSIPDQIGNSVGNNTTILLIQNGLKVADPYLQVFPQNEILSALAFVCSNRIDVCHVDHLDYGRIVIGSHQDGANRLNRMDEIISLFQQSGVPVEKSGDIDKDRWIKLVWNVPFNPLSVICGGVTTDEILSDPLTENLARDLMKEVIDAARLSGIEISDSLIDEMMDRTKRMKPYKTSMLLDYEAGRSMEVEAILGDPIREVIRHGGNPVRMNTIYSILSLMNRRNS